MHFICQTRPDTFHYSDIFLYYIFACAKPNNSKRFRDQENVRALKNGQYLQYVKMLAI